MVEVECRGCAYSYLLHTGREGEEERGGGERDGPPPPGCGPAPQSYLTLCDMCRGVSISSKMAPFTLEPRRFASCRSQPDRSQFCRTGEKKTRQRSALIGCRVSANEVTLTRFS